MTTRERAIQQAIYKVNRADETGFDLADYAPDARAALAASDAVLLSDATVERAARALHDRMRSQAACSCCFTAWEDASDRTRESYRDDARAVLAAAVEEDGE